MNEQTVADLNAALEVLDERGWCQGVWRDNDGKVCAYEALRVVVYGDSPDAAEEVDRLQSALCALHGHLGTTSRRPLTIADYNDHPSTTLEDVKLMFKHAVEIAQGGAAIEAEADE